MVLHGLAPDYLSEMLLFHEPGRRLRSSGSSLLAVPRIRTKTFADAPFSRYALSCWNSLPEDLRGAENIDTFKHKLKTHLLFILILFIITIIYFINVSILLKSIIACIIFYYYLNYPLPITTHFFLLIFVLFS